MKPDIVFFGEGLPEGFHTAMAKDKDECDLLIVIGSSLKVRPVALIPSKYYYFKLYPCDVFVAHCRILAATNSPRHQSLCRTTIGLRKLYCGVVLSLTLRQSH